MYGDDDDDVITSGPFANLMRPHEMQPIYLLPLTNGVKQLLTFCVFGFDFKTDFKKGSAMKKLAGFFVAYLAKLAFIFLAFNSYVSDFRKFQSREAPKFSKKRTLTLVQLLGIQPVFFCHTSC